MGETKSNEPPESEILSQCRWLTNVKGHSSHLIFPATEPFIAWMRNIKRIYHFQGTYQNNKSLINTTLASNLLCIYNRNCQCYDIEKAVPTPRRSKDEEQVEEQLDLDSEQLTSIAKKNSGKSNKFDSTRCYHSLSIARRCFTELTNKQHLP